MTRTLFALAALAMLRTPIVLGEEARTIAVDGHGEITVEPDSARVELAVSIVGKKLPDAKREVDKVMTSLLEVAKRLKIADDDVTASELQVIPEYDYENGRSKFVAFETARSMTLTLRKLSKLDELLNACIEAGANRIDEIELQTSKEKELKNKALELAIADAIQRAGKIAAGFGVELRKVHKVAGDEGAYVTLLSAPINGLTDATYKPGKIKVGVAIGVVFQLK